MSSPYICFEDGASAGWGRGRKRELKLSGVLFHRARDNDAVQILRAVLRKATLQIEHVGVVGRRRGGELLDVNDVIRLAKRPGAP